MTKISKIMLASALTLAFAAPAFADESATQRERNTFSNPAGVSGQVESIYGTEAFASTRMPDRAQRDWMLARPSNDWAPATSGKDLSITRER